MVRIVVADDHALVRDILRRVIERERDMEIVGEAATGVSTVERVRALRPDVLLLDLTMPGGGGIAALAEITAASEATRILVLTMHDDPACLRAALTAGAAGFLCKDAAGRELGTAIRALFHGHTYVDSIIGGAALVETLRPAAPPAAAARAGVGRSSWIELVAAALSHDLIDVAVEADSASGDSDRLRGLGVRLRTLASVGKGAGAARVDRSCESAAVETTRLPTQTLAVKPISPELRVAGSPAAVRTVIVSLLDHVFAACPDAASVQLSARRVGREVVFEIVAPEAWTVSATDNQPLDLLLATERRDLRGDSALVIAGAIADALGGGITMTSGAELGLRLVLRLAAASA